MKVELRYFTGTGNSLKILDTCRELFTLANHLTNISAINVNNNVLPEADLTGFCFPVYSFGIPRICRNYLKAIKPYNKKQNVFILITAGDPDESGFSVRECTTILKKKNCEILYTAIIHMPTNWTTFSNPPSEEECTIIIDRAIEKTQNIVGEIMKGIKSYHRFNIPRRHGRLGLYSEYLLFKHLGIYNLWRLFDVYDSCEGCGLCSAICPTNSIMMVDKKPEWSSTCEQCMRCVNFCPNGSIYQSYGGSTKGKERYTAPGFKPLQRQ